MVTTGARLCAQTHRGVAVMPEPNDHLRRARERIESPNATGHPLSRQELADLITQWLYKNGDQNAVIDANYIGKLELGNIGWPQNTLRRQAFREVLGAGSDAELGFRRPRRSRSTVDDVDRKQFLQAAAGVAASAAIGQPRLADLITPTQPTPVPTTIGMADVDEVRTAATAFGSWDAIYGGGLVREAVTAQLQHCVELLNARASEKVRADMFGAVGYLAHVTAFMAFDAYAHDDARRMFRFALSCAEEGDDWHLRAKVLSSMARQAIWCGDPDQGLTFTELALVRSDRLTPTERAMLHTGRARALAKLRRVEDTAAAVGVADSEFSHARPENDPPWMAYYDSAQHAGDTGHALWDTAMHGHFVGEARARLAFAVAGHDDRYKRSKAISQTKLASLVMTTGDPTEAATAGMQALEWSGAIRSKRAADDMRELRRVGERHKNVAEVAELRSRIGAAVVPL
ncbi:XRE family transcriptional regulator [Amycolatopsis carbonis]|uniref:XRE family transcriptional regulator n=1 Tax=Amycolatopsis carbonis TaxID=715471 RepID=A0A9Y2MPH3_9PSEU|nr:XRE family transcriptional regulator [Amycolatopsis sp. 2-15]WIX76030.1 XRE family transcriptional regulator [Amycolatopsis sp. 2-15]